MTQRRFLLGVLVGGRFVSCFFAFAEATTKERLAQGDTIVMHAERSTDGDDPVARSLVERMFSVCSRGFACVRVLIQTLFNVAAFILRYLMRFQILRKVLCDDCHCVEVRQMDRFGGT